MDLILITRTLNTILATIGILGWIYFYIKTKEPFALAPLSWLVSLFAFYIYRLFTLSFSSAIKNTQFLNLWSSLLHTHALLLLFFGSILIYSIFKTKKECIDRLEEERRRIYDASNH